jgi:glycosyltransferase involved in cell wall biosynthesis
MLIKGVKSIPTKDKEIEWRKNREEKREKILISIVIPVYNEKDNIEELHKEISDVIDKMENFDFEIIYVDDGSYDGSYEVLKKIAISDSRVKVIRFKKNFGQTIAIRAGFDFAKGDIIITMDSDRQNDPKDIPNIVEKLINENLDIVSGWRKERKDKFIRVFFSNIANKIISIISGVKLHDYGCTLKAYRKEIVENLELFGDMHRFIPAVASFYGARVGELVVNHRPRLKGKSKYGLISRVFKTIIDMVFLKFFLSFQTRPMRFFGYIGISVISLGVLISLFVLYQKYFLGVWVHRNPLFMISIFFVISGLHFIMTGIIAEILIRVYFSSDQRRKPYFIQEILESEEVQK